MWKKKVMYSSCSLLTGYVASYLVPKASFIPSKIPLPVYTFLNLESLTQVSPLSFLSPYQNQGNLV